MEGNGKALETQFIEIYSINKYFQKGLWTKNKTNSYLHLKFMYIVSG